MTTPVPLFRSSRTEAGASSATQQGEQRLAIEARVLQDLALRIQVGEPFVAWPAPSREVLLLAIYPDKSVIARPGGVAWTAEGEKALRLLRHLIYRPHASADAARLLEMRKEVPEATAILRKREAEAARSHLASCCALWAFNFDAAEAAA